MPRTIYLPAYLQVCECAEALGSGVAELSSLLLSGADGRGGGTGGGGGPGGPWPLQKFEWVGQGMFWPPPPPKF